MKKYLLAALLVVVLSGSALAEKYNYTISTSSLGSGMYILGTAWAKNITDYVPEAVASAQSTSGAAANVQLMEAEENLLGLTSNAAGYDGWYGSGWAKGREYRNTRVLFPFYSSQWQMITLNPKLRKMEDIVGHSVSVGGAPGATSDIVIRDCMAVMGFEPGSIQYITTSNGVNYLRDGRIDAVAFVMGVPTSYVLELETSLPVRLMTINKESVMKVCAAKPYYSYGIIPGGVYKNEPNDLDTIVSWTFAIAHKNVPEEIAYQMVKAVFEHHDDFVAAHSSAKTMEAKSVVNAAIPLHPGAVRYYREAGIDIPEKLLPPEMK